MQIQRIQYEACFNLGNYENEKLRLEATISPDADLKAAFHELRQRCIECAQPDAQKVYNERRKLQHEVMQLQQKLDEMKRNWETVSSFLVAQGIKPDVADFPILNNLLPAPAVEAEIVEDF